MTSEPARTSEPETPRYTLRELVQADRLGLIAMWSRQFGYVSVHDPTTGEWHDLPTKDAPGWVKREVFKRKELRKYHSITRLLTRADLEEIYHEEHGKEEGIAEDDVAVDERGVVYEDYIEED